MAGTSLDESLADLAERAAALARHRVDDLCDHLLREADASDDVALLAVRIDPDS